MNSNYSKYIVDPKQVKDGNFSQVAGFKRLGIHYVTLLPGQTSSLPHAESLEEEFVYVVSGNPHAWINGYIYELKPHFAVGFPAGTGIAHNFINNSNEPVELIVVGERTKKENRCAFPVNPEQQEKCEIWWEDAPRHELGPHNGKPGKVLPHELGENWPEFIVNCLDVKLNSGWHYPGDSETFGDYARLTDLLGLKALGIGFEILKPGKRSSFPHAHLKEEEFGFILEGTATVWLNGFVQEAQQGMAALFPPGTNIAHTFINNSEIPVIYLGIGEAKNVDGPDKIFYPMHPFRNDQCKKRGNFWTERPTEIPFGTHKGIPNSDIKDHLALTHIGPQDHNLLLEIFKASPKYFLQLNGNLPTIKSVDLALTEGPATLGQTCFKESLLLNFQEEPIGFADIIINHPDRDSAYLGLLLLRESFIGKGLGRKFYELLEHYLKNVFATKKILLGISLDKNEEPFWHKMGFKENGRTYIWQGEQKENAVLEFEKNL